MSRGRLIVVEGGEGSGKSTQAELLAEERGALLTRQPGGTALGARIRELLLTSADDELGTRLDDRAEALLMAADRAQHVSEVIEPALVAGQDVVCDRYIGSTIAYQGYGRGLDVDIVRAVSGWAAGGLWPDLVVLLVVPDDVAAGRIGSARDRIEAAGEEFHRRASREGFAAQADDDPDTWVVVDGTGSVDEVHERVLDAIDDVFGTAAMSEVLADDLWAEVVGQPVAVEQLRSAVAAPVHAYLIVGPEGSGKRAAAVAFAAELLGSGLDEAGGRHARRLAAAEAHPSLTVVEREGASITIEQADEVVRQSSMAPPEGDRQVIVLVDFHLVGNRAPKLLKSIEEPPPTTIFVVLAEEVTPDLVTIASRCVQVDLAAVPEQLLVERLVSDGVAPATAQVAAAAAGGSLSRARLLAHDPEVAGRREAWYRAPERLDGTGSGAASLADELLSGIDGVMAPLAEQHAEQMARFVAGFEAAGIEPRKGDVKRLEDRHKREQRRVRVDELRSGLATLVSRYRDELADGGSHEDFLAAAGAVQDLCDGLAFNPNDGLQLRALLARLPTLGPSAR